MRSATRSPARSQRWILILRIGLLALAAAVVAVALVAARRHDQATRPATGASAAFVCPMHAEMSSGSAGECPICGMALVKAGAVVHDTAAVNPSEEAASGEDTIAAAQLLSKAAGGLASNLVGYYPSPVRQHVLRYEIYAPAWVEHDNLVIAQLYDDQLPTLEPDERASFAPTASLSADTAAARDVRRVADTAAQAPWQPWDRSTSLVRFTVEAGASPLPAGTVGWVKFARRPRQMMVIPAGAVLESPEGPYVLVLSRADGAAKRRAIEVGRITTGVAAVLSGLNLREQVVSVNAFFWDAERRLQGDRARTHAVGGAGAPP